MPPKLRVPRILALPSTASGAAVLGVAVLGAALLAAACSPDASREDVTVVGRDYAFEAPDTLPAGPTSLQFENRGEVPHEMVLVRLKEGVTLDEVMEGLAGGAAPEDFVEGGFAILIAGPGEASASRLHVDLLPGRTYALVCNLRDAPDEPPHTALGMRAAVQVEG